MKKNNKLEYFFISILFLSIITCKNNSNNFDKNYIGAAVIKAKNGLVLRSNPGIDSKKIIIIPNNKTINIIKFTNIILTHENITAPWVLINHQTYKGYVFSGFLKKFQYNKNLVKLQYPFFTIEKHNNHLYGIYTDSPNVKKIILNFDINTINRLGINFNGLSKIHIDFKKNNNGTEIQLDSKNELLMKIKELCLNYFKQNDDTYKKLSENNMNIYNTKKILSHEGTFFPLSQTFKYRKKIQQNNLDFIKSHELIYKTITITYATANMKFEGYGELSNNKRIKKYLWKLSYVMIKNNQKIINKFETDTCFFLKDIKKNTYYLVTQNYGYESHSLKIYKITENGLIEYMDEGSTF